MRNFERYDSDPWLQELRELFARAAARNDTFAMRVYADQIEARIFELNPEHE